MYMYIRMYTNDTIDRESYHVEPIADNFTKLSPINEQ